MRFLAVLLVAMMVLPGRPAGAAGLDLDALTERIAGFVSSLAGGAPDPEVIAAPRDIDRKMVLTPPRSAAQIRNILPRGSGALRQN